MEVPTESLDKSLLEFNNLLSPANLRVKRGLLEVAMLGSGRRGCYETTLHMLTPSYELVGRQR